VVRAAATLMRSLALVLAGAGGGCATFEDPTIVLDLRVVAMTAEPPEQVVDLELSGREPPDPEALLAQLAPTRTCVYVADPGVTRDLRWSMTACLASDDLRCDPALPQVFLAEGMLGDPEVLADGGRACALIEYDVDPAGWLALLGAALRRDPTRGLAGLDYALEVRLGDPAEPAALDVFGVKQARVSARLPAMKVANHNPSLADLQLSVRQVRGESAPRRRCAERDPEHEFKVISGDRVTLFPVEPGQGTDEPAREEFTVPTLDGGFETFTETLSYQWLAGAGAFQDPVTGGPPDIFGNETLLGTDWTAPRVSAPTDVPIWLIQRDERYGASVTQTCIRVMP
jgi:hypothetical protein